MRNNKRFLSVMPLLALGLSFVVLMSFAGCAGRAGTQTTTQNQAAAELITPTQTGIPRVYFTSDISPAGLMAVYEALGLTPNGNVAVKVHTGEPGNPHYLNPELIRDLVQRVNGTIVETNTAYGGRRASTAMHMQVARDHGFTAIAPVVILDESADISLPVTGGRHITENYVGARFNEFNFHVVLSHFKGHAMGGFGGALKNISIGYASAAGKLWLHTAGSSRTSWMATDQNSF